MSRDKGYLFPDPIDPGETECFVVYVPKHTLYLAAFWRSYEYLTTWHAWQPDIDKTAKDVAALWQAAFQLARDKYEAGERCQLYDLRYKPTDPTITQASVDSGVSWFDIHRDCSCDTTIYPDVTDPDLRADFVYSFYYLMKFITQEVVDGINAAQTRIQVQDNIMAILSPYGANASVRAQIGIIFDEVTTQGVGAVAEWLTDCPYVPWYVALLEFVESLPVLAINEISDWFIDQLNDPDIPLTDVPLWNALNTAAAAMAGGAWSWSQGSGGAGGGAGFGDTCGWTHTFTFVGGAEGWVNHSIPTYNPDIAGTLVGEDWEATYREAIGDPNSYGLHVDIMIDFDERYITTVEFDYQRFAFHAFRSWVMWYGPGDGTQFAIANPDPNEVGVFTASGVLNEATTRIRIIPAGNNVKPNELDDPLHVLTVRISGNGIDPF